MCKTNPIPGGRDTPPFQYSTIPAFQSDTDRAKRTQFGPGRCGSRRVKDAKRTQFAARRTGVGGTDRAKRTQFPAAPGRSRPGGRGTRGVVQTNPIPAIMPIRRSAFPGGQIARNEPNSRRCRVGRGPQGKCAKRTQFSLGKAGSRRAKDAKQTQFAPTHGEAQAPEGQLCKTNPISVAVGQDTRSPWCETKPIASVAAKAESGASGKPKMSGEDAQPTKSRGAVVRNKANCIRGPLELAGSVRYHSCPSNRPCKG